jgi:peptide/nickel transport system substrate-binding protein
MIVADEVPYLPLWQSKDYAFAQSDIDGVQLNATQQILPFSTIRQVEPTLRGGE